MAEVDLDTVIRQISKSQTKSLMDAAKKRRDLYLARAARTKDKEARDRFKLLAKSTMLHGAAASRRLQNSADNTADSYSRAMKHAAEQPFAKKPASKKEA